MCFCETIYVNRRLKSTPLKMLAILRGAPAVLVICITYVLFCFLPQLDTFYLDRLFPLFWDVYIYLLGFETNVAFYSVIKTSHGTSALFGRHFVSSSSFSPRARSFKLRKSGTNFSVSCKCLPQGVIFCHDLIFSKQADLNVQIPLMSHQQ